MAEQPLMTTAGRALVNDALPAAYRDYNRTFDAKAISEILGKVANDDPDSYLKVSKKLLDAGQLGATLTGGYSFDLDDLRQSQAGLAAAATAVQLVRETAQKVADPAKRREALVNRLQDLVKVQSKDVYDESTAAKNPFALQVRSGAKGNPGNLLSLLGAPLLYVDNKDRAIPIPVSRSYSQGLTPAQYIAAAYGSRKGIVNTKLAVADSGYAAKRLKRAAHRLVVTEYDDDPDYDAEAPKGLPVSSDDGDSVGSLLAAPVGPFARDTAVTPRLLATLRQLGIKDLLVRSPIVGGPADGGVSAKAAGLNEFGRLPYRREAPGMGAADAIAEPLSQATLGSKHSGGAAGSGGAVSGYRAINATIEVPKKLAGGMVHAEADGRVTSVRPSSTGGAIVMVGRTEHYVPSGMTLAVKIGDEIEAGDALSDGIPSPAKIVEHKGIGEGRRYFTNVFSRIVKASGMPADRRNVEMLARGLIDHVKYVDADEDHVPDDIISYREFASRWEPRPDSRIDRSGDQALGRYLEAPVLHYTIGTKVRPSVVRELNKFKVGRIVTNEHPIPVSPVMVRAADTLSHDPDWMTSMYGSGLQKKLLRDTHRGAVSDEEGTSFVPGLARRTGFAETWSPTPFAEAKDLPKAAADAYEVAGADSPIAGLAALDPEAMNTIFGTKPKGGLPGQYGASGAPVTNVSAASEAAAKNKWLTPLAVGAGGVAAGAAGASYLASRPPTVPVPSVTPAALARARPPATPLPDGALRATPKLPTTAPGGVPAVAGPNVPQAAKVPLAERISAPAATNLAKATPKTNWGKVWNAGKQTSSVAGRVAAPVGLAYDTYNQGSTYRDAYNEGGISGLQASAKDQAINRFAPLRKSIEDGDALGVAGGVLDTVYNAPKNLNLIGAAAMETAGAKRDVADAVGGSFPHAVNMAQGKTPGNFGQGYRYPSIVDALTKSDGPYPAVEAVTERVLSLPERAATVANQAATTSFTPIQGLRQFFGGDRYTGQARNPLTGEVIRPFWE